MHLLILAGILILLGVAAAIVLSLFFSILIGVGTGLSLIACGAGIYWYLNADSFNNKGFSLGLTGLGGLFLGASIGALVGSIVPGLGTALGAICGSLIGLAAPVIGLLLFDVIIGGIHALRHKTNTLSFTSSTIDFNFSPKRTTFPNYTPQSKSKLFSDSYYNREQVSRKPQDQSIEFASLFNSLK
jgi:MFS family permease